MRRWLLLWKTAEFPLRRRKKLFFDAKGAIGKLRQTTLFFDAKVATFMENC